MIYGYARSATFNHDENSIFKQQKALEEAGAELNNICWEVCSGLEKERPGLRELFQKMKSGDTLLITSMDRLSRDAMQVFNFYKAFKDKGVTVKFIKGCDEIMTSEPHLIETTMLGYEKRTYTPTVCDDKLTEEEKRIVAESRKYEKEYRAKENARSLELARNDFEKLRDIKDMPEEAIKILKEWTSRDEDYEEYDE